MRIDSQVSAKVLKRVNQVRRLGTRGIVRTAYVRTLGPTVYSLTDSARSVTAGLHRRRTLSRSLSARLERLKERAPGEIRSHRRRGMRVEFGADIGRFVQTLEAMLDLAAAGCAVARVVEVDWSVNAITSELVLGRTFRDKSKGDSLDETTSENLAEALIAIHRAGYVLGEIVEEDIIFAGNGPAVTNLALAAPLAGVSRDMSIYLRDLDRQTFNKLFGTRLSTAAELRSLGGPPLVDRSGPAPTTNQVYAPVILRDDIRWGKIWNTDVGIGRWNFIMKEHLPIPRGGSVLDLGSNNGFNPLQMLRAGAASAVGVEMDAQVIEQGRFLKSAFEWLDNRSYDFRYIQGSQADLPSFDLPRFDMVTAFCSLYYLPEQEVRDLVRYIRTLTDVLVVQCNIDRLLDRGGEEETFRKASVEFAVEMLEQGGFANRKIIAPPGYSRPLIIGRAN